MSVISVGTEPPVGGAHRNGWTPPSLRPSTVELGVVTVRLSQASSGGSVVELVSKGRGSAAQHSRQSMPSVAVKHELGRDRSRSDCALRATAGPLGKLVGLRVCEALALFPVAFRSAREDRRPPCASVRPGGSGYAPAYRALPPRARVSERRPYRPLHCLSPPALVTERPEPLGITEPVCHGSTSRAPASSRFRPGSIRVAGAYRPARTPTRPPQPPRLSPSLRLRPPWLTPRNVP